MKCCLACGELFFAGDWRCPACANEPPKVGGFYAFAPDIAQGASGYDPVHFSEIARLEAAHFWYQSRNRLIVWALRRYFPRCRSFFEAGCGTGAVLSGVAVAFPEWRLVAGEASTAALSRAAERVPTAELAQMDAGSIPYRNEFDVVGAFDVIEHIHEHEKVLAALHDAVVPGGGLLITVPQHPFLWSEFDVRSGHLRRYRAVQLREMVVEAGFEVLSITSFMSLLLPGMLWSRLGRRNRKSGYHPVDELRVPHWLNSALDLVLGAERLLLRTGLSLPAGGSLLVVARRPPERPSLASPAL